MNIETYLPVFPGFYNTFFEPDETSEIEYINEQRMEKNLPEIGYDDCEWNYEEYNQEISKSAVNAIEAKLNEIGISIKILFQALHSPREYNFYSDTINVEMKITKIGINDMRKYINNNKRAFSDYLKVRYTSRSGFISSYSNDYDVWMGEYFRDLENHGHYLGAILDFILANEEYSDYNLYEDCEGAGSVYAENYEQLIRNIK